MKKLEAGVSNKSEESSEMKKEAMLYEKLDNKQVHCYLCAHQCKISPSQFGICGVRQNIDGTLHTLVYGDVIASHIDPIEKKPLYHFLPGTSSYSIATIGCNFRCGFCQNWQISQISKKDNAHFGGQELLPDQVVKEAIEHDSKSISYTYTEPTIFFEYAYDTARLAKDADLYSIFVTNGYMTKQALDTIHPFLDAANVDLKSFREEYYIKNCKAHLQPVLDAISYMKKLGIWLEITTLVIPGENDSQEELTEIAQFIAHIDKGIPWHVSRFHPDYKFDNYQATPIDVLRKAWEIGEACGLRYIYLGNVLEDQDTYCHSCKQPLVKRAYLNLETFNIKDGRCRFCKAKIDGIWEVKDGKNKSASHSRCAE